MSYKINISKEIYKEVLGLIPKASASREATENYEKAIREEVLNLFCKIKKQIENAVMEGKSSITVEVNPQSFWSLDLKYYTKEVLSDLGYKIILDKNEPYKFIIEW